MSIGSIGAGAGLGSTSISTTGPATSVASTVAALKSLATESGDSELLTSY